MANTYNKFGVWAESSNNINKSSTFTNRVFVSNDTLSSKDFNSFIREMSLVTVSLLDAVLNITGSTTLVEIDPLSDDYGVTRDDLVTLITAALSSNLVSGGTATKVSYNQQGRIVGASNLEASDIPTLPQSKITNLTRDLGKLKIGNTWYTATLSGSTLNLTSN